MRMDERLDAAFPESPEPDATTTAALEDQLAHQLGQGEPAKPRRAGPRRRWLALALGGLTLAAACVAPATYEMDFGHRIAFSVPPEHIDFDPSGVAEHIESNFAGVEEIRVMAQITKLDHDDGSPVSQQFRIAVDVVGEVDMRAVETSLVDSFPVLEPGAFDIQEIDGTVHGTLGGLLSHRALGWVVDEQSAAFAREQILADLAARGIETPASVKVDIEEETTPRGIERKVRVGIEPVSPEVPPSGQ